MVEEIKKFEKARIVFKEIKKKIENEKFRPIVSEFKKAIQKLIVEYNTADWENRFIVGGVLEILFTALLNSLNFECKLLKEQRYDIQIDGVKFSLKSNFVGSGDIRLINVLGNGKVSWEEPTLFFISEKGIYYADPEMKLVTKQIRDALTIGTKEIEKISSEWKITILIPRKLKNSKVIKTASYDVAKFILEEIGSQYLKNYLPKI